MPDEFAKVRIVTKGLQRSLEDIERRSRRATMWAVRDAGRKVKSEARKHAPVYRGPNAGPTVRSSDAVDSTSTRPQPGVLKISISSSKRLYRYGPDAFGVRVAPRGYRVHFYSQQAESIYHYMRNAYDAIEDRFDDIAAKAWARAMKRGR